MLPLFAHDPYLYVTAALALATLGLGLWVWHSLTLLRAERKTGHRLTEQVTAQTEEIARLRDHDLQLAQLKITIIDLVEQAKDTSLAVRHGPRASEVAALTTQIVQLNRLLGSLPERISIEMQERIETSMGKHATGHERVPAVPAAIQEIGEELKQPTPPASTDGAAQTRVNPPAPLLPRRPAGRPRSMRVPPTT